MHYLWALEESRGLCEAQDGCWAEVEEEGRAVISMAAQPVYQTDSHGKLVLLLRSVRTGSSFGVWGVPRVVGALVESPSVKASMSGDWGELSMWQAVSAFWYCWRVIWKEVDSG